MLRYLSEGIPSADLLPTTAEGWHELGRQDGAEGAPYRPFVAAEFEDAYDAGLETAVRESVEAEALAWSRAIAVQEGIHVR